MSDVTTRTWQGYQRPDGRKGVRNIVLVMEDFGGLALLTRAR